MRVTFGARPSGYRSVRRSSALIAIAILTLSIWLAPPAGAATFTVTNTNDSGAGSLRQAIADANAVPGADTIDFAVTGTITLTSGQLTVVDDLTIDGPGAASLTVSGNNASLILEVADELTLNLKGVTLANGAAADGAGIFNLVGATINVANSTFSGNSAGTLGGGIFSVGGPVTVADSTFSGNSAGGAGGGVFSQGTLTVTNSTFSGNSAGSQGGALSNNAGSGIIVTNSTFSGNSGGVRGGAIFDGSGGTLTFTNSTFSGNSALDEGGALYGGILTLTNSTLSSNSAGLGGAIHSNGALTLENTVVADSPSGGNCSGATPVDGGGNLQHPGSDCGATIPSADPLLGPLEDNGGPTQTMAPQAGSPAIDGAVLANCPATDQRGVSRPQGAGCDIGSVEVQSVVYVFEGFFAPIDNVPVVNKAKAGQTIAVKWRLTDSSGAPIDDPASFESLTSGSSTCDPDDPADAIETYSGGSGLLYLGDGNWQFNWRTPKSYAGKCKVMMLNLADGSTHTALFQFA